MSREDAFYYYILLLLGLYSYCVNYPFDQSIVCDKVRLYYKNVYYLNKMNKKEIISSMYHLVNNIISFDDFDMKVWEDMLNFDYYYDLAIDNIISMTSFDNVFFSYLNDGKTVNSEDYWMNNKKEVRLFDKLINIFKK